MCATRFSTSRVTRLRMTERNTTKRGYAIWKRKRDQCRCDDGWKNYAGFVSRPDIFVRKVSTKCMTKRMEPHLWWSLLIDHSGQQIDWLTYTQIHHWVSRLSVFFIYTRDSSVFWCSNQAYPAVYVIWSKWSFKVKATYFSVGFRKMVTVKCYVS